MIEDYDSYHFSVKEYIRYILQGAFISAIIGILFYQHIIGAILVSPLILFYCHRKKKALIKKRKWQLNLEFKDGILSLSAALEAGYSAENALEEALKELRLIYDNKALIIREFTYLLNQVRMNITVEKALSEFGERCGVEDIVSFAQVFVTAKRTGGDLVSIIKSTADTITDKIEVKREIITMTAAKKYEADIMRIMPLGIISYLLFSSPGFLDPLYHNLFGVAVMSFLLLVYTGAYLFTDKIIAIEI